MNWRSSLVAAAWLAAVAVLFQLFDYWQTRPLRKAAVFLVIGGLCWIFYRLSSRTGALATVSSRSIRWTAAGAAILVLGYSVAHGVITFADSLKSGDVFHDQGQIADRALRLAAQGVNPYGRGTMLDPLAFSDQVHRLAGRPRCGSVDADAAQRAFAEYWYGGLDSRRMRSLAPEIGGDPSCDDLRVKFQSLGYHYGPVLLLSYLPFVAAFGAAGIYASHLLALLAWFVVLGVWLRTTLARTDWMLAGSAITLFLLAPVHVHKIYLELTASDLIPTALASAALMLWLQRRDVPAAVVLAASVGAKLSPALLFTPLLLRNVRSAMVFVACAIAVYLPFALLDAVGLYQNLLYPFTLRDTTSPLAAMPEAARLLVRVAAAVGFAAWIWRLASRRWPEAESLLFLVNVHLAALILGGMSHNNYLIWAMSIIALFWIRLVDRPDT